jgi:hypothetical protein
MSLLNVGEMINAYKIVVETTEAKKPLGRPMRRWEDTIKMELNPLKTKLV